MIKFNIKFRFYQEDVWKNLRLMVFSLIIGVIITIIGSLLCCGSIFYQDNAYQAYIDHQDADYDAERAKCADQNRKKKTLWKYAFKVIIKGIFIMIVAEVGIELLSLIRC